MCSLVLLLSCTALFDGVLLVFIDVVSNVCAVAFLLFQFVVIEKLMVFLLLLLFIEFIAFVVLLVVC